MGKQTVTTRWHDDSDVFITFDPRARVLDVPDDGRVIDLLSRPIPGRPVKRPEFSRFDAPMPGAPGIQEHVRAGSS